MVIPEWKSAYFWPIFINNERFFKSLVLEYLILQPCFVFTNSTMFKGFTNFKTIALYLDFSKPL